MFMYGYNLFKRLLFIHLGSICRPRQLRQCVPFVTPALLIESIPTQSPCMNNSEITEILFNNSNNTNTLTNEITNARMSLFREFGFKL